MIIDKVLFCIDDNDHYKGFWPSISKHFKLKMKMQPKLFVITEKDNLEDYDTSHGEVELMKPIKEVPMIVQALWGKFYYTKTEPETTWLIGDIDLYPLQTFHFTEKIKEISEDSYVHLNPHAYGVGWRNSVSGLAGYFHAGKGKTFIEELKLHNSMEYFAQIIMNPDNKYGIKYYWSGQTAPYIENENASKEWGWFCCEEMLSGHLLKNSTKLVELPPSNGWQRINRTNMQYDANLIKSQHYIDFHAPRPYEQHKETIEHILSFFNP